LSDKNQYLQMFFDESREYIQMLNEGVLALENNPEDSEIINTIFRAAHSLKGMAATMGFDSLTELTHKVENILDRVRNDELKIETELIDLLFSGLDHIEDLVAQIKETGDEQKDVEEYLDQLEAYTAGNNGSKDETKDESQEKENEKEKNENEKEIDEIKLNKKDIDIIKSNLGEDDLIYQISITIDEDSALKSARGYMVVKKAKSLGYFIKSVPEETDIKDDEKEIDEIKLVILSHEESEDIKNEIKDISDINEVKVTKREVSLKEEDDEDKSKKKKKSKKKSSSSSMSSFQTSSTVRVDIEKLDKLMNMVGELLINKTRLESLGIEKGQAKDILTQLDRVTMELHYNVMQIRMVPVKHTFNRFPRMIRDISKDLNKEINFMMEGEETELDRSIIDELSDPLTHLLRNSVDHGIEDPDLREKKGKDREGTINLRAYQKGSEIIIEVEDDGAGIDEDKLVEKAVEKDVITESEAKDMDKHDKLQLMFAAGLSTSEEVSDVSGRGVGMDVVKKTVENLDGQIYIDSEVDKGTKITISLPLTLAITEALMLKVNDEVFALPLNSINETMRISHNDIKKINGEEVISFRDKTIPLLDSRAKLNMEYDQNEYKEKEEISVVVVNSSGKLVALKVDELLHQQEIVIKSLSEYLDNVKNISGATIIGDGEVALILDVRDIA